MAIQVNAEIRQIMETYFYTIPTEKNKFILCLPLSETEAKQAVKEENLFELISETTQLKDFIRGDEERKEKVERKIKKEICNAIERGYYEYDTQTECFDIPCEVFKNLLFVIPLTGPNQLKIILDE